MQRKWKIAIGLAAAGGLAWWLWRTQVRRPRIGGAPQGRPNTLLTPDGSPSWKVNFAHDQAWIEDQQSFSLLNEAADFLLRNPTICVEVQGHTSAPGTDAYNLDLSQRRAENVVQYLIDVGVSPERLTAVGYGESQPVGDDAQNRRVEFLVVAC